VALIPQLILQHGQGGRMGFRNHRFRYSSSFLLADPNECWVLETAGRFWAADRVTGVRTLSNGLTLGVEAVRKDPAAVAFAQKKGRCRGAYDFDFAATFKDPVMTALAGAAIRRSCTTTRLSAAPTDFAVTATALRDHGGHDLRAGVIMKMPCAHASWLPTRTSGQTTASLIARLTPGGVRVWATGTSSPCLSVFKPVPLGTGTLLRKGPAAGTRADDESLFWRHERLHRQILAGAAPPPSFHEERMAFEARCRDDVAGAAAVWEEHRAQVVHWRAQLPPPVPRGAFTRWWRRQAARDGLPA
jgi:secernin